MRALSFDKLNIDAESWAFSHEEDRFAYRFYSPSDGVLVLDLVGVLNTEYLPCQIDFINNFIIEVNKKVKDINIVLIFNLSGIVGVQPLKIIRRHLTFIHADFFFFVSANAFQKTSLKVISKIQNRSSVFVFSLLSDALALADKINSHHFLGNGKFYQFWASNQLVYQYKNQEKKYIQLAHWQYGDENRKAAASVRYYEEGIIHFKASGVVSAVDVHEMLKIIFEVGDSLAIDLRKKQHSYIFDLRNVDKITPDARRLLHKLNRTEHLAKGDIIVIGSSGIRFLLQVHKLNFYCAFCQIRLVKSLHRAFESIHQGKNRELIKLQNPTTVPVPEDYDSLKKLYIETNQKLKEEYKKKAHTVRSVQNTLEIVRSGQFENIKLTPDYWGAELADEVLKVLSILQNDLPHFRKNNADQAMSVAFAQSNLRKIVNALSDPVFVFHNNQIICANHQLLKLLHCSELNVEQMPLSAIVVPPDVATVEAHLNVFDAHNSITCTLQTCNGDALYVNLVFELIVVDGENAQLVFIKRAVLSSASLVDEAKHVWLRQPACITNLEKAQVSLLNAYAILFAEIQSHSSFHEHTVNTVEYFLEQRFVSQLSYFIQGVQQEISSLQKVPQHTFIVLPHDCVGRLFRVFNAFARMNVGRGNSVLLEIEPVQTLSLVISDVFINTVLFKLGQILSFNCENTVLTFGFKQTENGTALFYIEYNYPQFDVISELKNTEVPGGLLFSHVEETLKCAGGRLFMDSTESKSVIAGLQIPVLARGGGFYGAMADFSFHTMLALIDSDYQLIENALLRTHASLIQKQSVFDAVRLDFTTLSLVIVDLQIHNGDAFDFIKKVKSVVPNLPVVAIANFSGHEEWKKVNNSQADAVIEFPINSNELIQTMQQLLTN